MKFQVRGLPLAPFTPLFGMADAQLASHAAVRRVADSCPGFPCRVSLQDAQPGETLILINYEHLPVAGPYRSSHAIFVRENAREAQVEVGEIPELLRSRLLSVRAFDGGGMMLDADVMEGTGIEPIIAKMLGDPRVHFLHVHNAKPGCFAASVHRAGE